MEIARRQLLRSSFATVTLSIDVTENGQPLPRKPEGVVLRHPGESNRPARQTVWWHRPDKWRDDYHFPTGSWIRSVYSGSRGAAYVSYSNALIFEEFLGTDSEGRRIPDLRSQIEGVYLLDEGFLSDGWETEVGGQTSWRERDALRLRARALGPISGSRGNPGLSDHWELVMDRLTGIFLCAEGFRDSVKVVELRVTALAIDAPIPETIFSLEPADLAAA